MNLSVLGDIAMVGLLLVAAYWVITWGTRNKDF